MKFSFNAVVQVLGTVAQGANSFGGFVPARYQVPFALGVGALQAVTALLSHFANPDGTPAAVAYKKAA